MTVPSRARYFGRLFSLKKTLFFGGFLEQIWKAQWILGRDQKELHCRFFEAGFSQSPKEYCDEPSSNKIFFMKSFQKASPIL